MLSLPGVVRGNTEFEFEEYGYRYVRRCGKGAYGTTYIVESLEDNNQWVAKQINLTELSAPDIATSKREAELAQRLKHPNVVRCVNSFLQDNESYLVMIMEYYEGGDLQSKIKEMKEEGKRFTEEELRAGFSQLLGALEYCHNLRIIHRDIKPANIMIASTGDLVLGDFGIAKVMEQTWDLASTCIGSTSYMAPEMYHRSYDHHSDLWGLACVIYEMATLEQAFKNDNLLNMVLNVHRFTPEIPESLGFSSALKSILKQMFSPKGVERGTARELLEMPYFSAALLTQKTGSGSLDCDVTGEGLPPPIETAKPEISAADEELYCRLIMKRIRDGLKQSDASFFYAMMETQMPDSGLEARPEINLSTAALQPIPEGDSEDKAWADENTPDDAQTLLEERLKLTTVNLKGKDAPNWHQLEARINVAWLCRAVTRFHFGLSEGEVQFLLGAIRHSSGSELNPTVFQFAELLQALSLPLVTLPASAELISDERTCNDSLFDEPSVNLSGEGVLQESLLGKGISLQKLAAMESKANSVIRQQFVKAAELMNGGPMRAIEKAVGTSLKAFMPRFQTIQGYVAKPCFMIAINLFYNLPIEVMENLYRLTTKNLAGDVAHGIFFATLELYSTTLDQAPEQDENYGAQTCRVAICAASADVNEDCGGSTSCPNASGPQEYLMNQNKCSEATSNGNRAISETLSKPLKAAHMSKRGCYSEPEVSPVGSLSLSTVQGVASDLCPETGSRESFGKALNDNRQPPGRGSIPESSPGSPIARTQPNQSVVGKGNKGPHRVVLPALSLSTMPDLSSPNRKRGNHDSPRDYYSCVEENSSRSCSPNPCRKAPRERKDQNVRQCHSATIPLPENPKSRHQIFDPKLSNVRFHDREDSQMDLHEDVDPNEVHPSETNRRIPGLPSHFPGRREVSESNMSLIEEGRERISSNPDIDDPDDDSYSGKFSRRGDETASTAYAKSPLLTVKGTDETIRSSHPHQRYSSLTASRKSSMGSAGGFNSDRQTYRKHHGPDTESLRFQRFPQCRGSSPADGSQSLLEEYGRRLTQDDRLIESDEDLRLHEYGDSTCFSDASTRQQKAGGGYRSLLSPHEVKEAFRAYQPFLPENKAVFDPMSPSSNDSGSSAAAELPKGFSSAMYRQAGSTAGANHSPSSMSSYRRGSNSKSLPCRAVQSQERIPNRGAKSESLTLTDSRRLGIRTLTLPPAYNNEESVDSDMNEESSVESDEYLAARVPEKGMQQSSHERRQSRERTLCLAESEIRQSLPKSTFQGGRPVGPVPHHERHDPTGHIPNKIHARETRPPLKFSVPQKQSGRITGGTSPALTELAELFSPGETGTVLSDVQSLWRTVNALVQHLQAERSNVAHCRCPGKYLSTSTMALEDVEFWCGVLVQRLVGKDIEWAELVDFRVSVCSLLSLVRLLKQRLNVHRDEIEILLQEDPKTGIMGRFERLVGYYDDAIVQLLLTQLCAFKVLVQASAGNRQTSEWADSFQQAYTESLHLHELFSRELCLISYMEFVRYNTLLPENMRWEYRRGLQRYISYFAKTRAKFETLVNHDGLEVEEQKHMTEQGLTLPCRKWQEICNEILTALKRQLDDISREADDYLRKLTPTSRGDHDGGHLWNPRVDRLVAFIPPDKNRQPTKSRKPAAKTYDRLSGIPQTCPDLGDIYDSHLGSCPYSGLHSSLLESSGHDTDYDEDPAMMDRFEQPMEVRSADVRQTSSRNGNSKGNTFFPGNGVEFTAHASFVADNFYGDVLSAKDVDLGRARNNYTLACESKQRPRYDRDYSEARVPRTWQSTDSKRKRDPSPDNQSVRSTYIPKPREGLGNSAGRRHKEVQFNKVFNGSWTSRISSENVNPWESGW